MAGVISNYTTLVSAVVNVTEDDSAEFRAYIPTAIGLAEDRLARELDSQLFLAQTTLALTQDSPFVEKPTGYRLGHELTFKTSSGDRRLLRKRTRGYCEVYWPYETSTAEPVYYADADVSTFLIVPTPQANSQVVMTYEKQPSKLSAASSVNALTTFYPNALFYAAMAEMSKFSKQWGQVPLWDAKYMEAVQGANNEGRRARRDSGEPLSNPHQVNNTLSGQN